MQIEEIGSQRKGQGIGNNGSGNAELKRMAQTMAAEQLASVHAANAGGQAVSSKGEIQEDAIKLSNKALSEVSTRNSADSMNRRDGLLSSLMEKLNSEIFNPDSEFNKQSEQNKKSEGAGGGQKKKKKEVKKEAEWTPKTEEGQIHPGRDVIGKVRVSVEVKESGGEEGGGVGGVGAAGGSKNSNKSGTPNYGKAAQNKSAEGQNQTPGAQKPSDTKDDNKEAKEASAVKSLEKAGLQSQDLEQQAKQQEAGDKSKIEEQAGGAGGTGGSKTEEYDVRTRATGTNQTLSVTPPKKINAGEGLRKFRKLDDKPLLKYATMHKQDFQGGNNEEAIKELKKNAQAAGESPEAIQQAVQLLKDRSRPDQ
ncbi:MAG: hypothetical protein WC314_02695 [Vulcanimicrobiota bacterium]